MHKGRVVGILLLALLSSLVAVSTSAEADHRRQPPVVVRSLSPDLGSAAGGTVVTIRGRHLAHVKAVLFGEVPGLVTRVGPRKLTVLAPAHVAGAVPVRVKAGGRTSRSMPFEYVASPATGSPGSDPPAPPTPPVPTVTKVSPPYGRPSGGETVTVTGTGFVGKVDVTFGGARARDVEVVSSSELTVTTPVHRVGQVQVRVSARSGTSGTGAASLFTFARPPTVEEIRPDSGPSIGGTRVTVIGTGFHDGDTVTFGQTPGTQVHLVSATELTVRAPAHPGGDVQVRVHGPGGPSAPGGQSSYRFTEPVVVTAPVPPGAWADPEVYLKDLACPSNDFCVAVGSYRHSEHWTRPLGDVLVDDEWTAVEMPLPSDALSGVFDRAQLTSVSCASATFCVAWGTYTRATGVYPLIETWNGTAWRASTLDFRTAAYNHTFDNGVVACPARDSCTAFFQYDLDRPTPTSRTRVATFDGEDWTHDDVELPDGATDGGLSRLDCPTADFCLAVGIAWQGSDPYYSFVSTIVHGDQAPSVPPLPPGASSSSLAGVSCLGPSHCRIVGGYAPDDGGESKGLIELLDNGAWTARTVPEPGPVHAGMVLLNVTCAEVDSCFMSGGHLDEQGVVASLDGDAVSSHGLDPEVVAAPPYGILGAVGCTTRHSCLTVGEAGAGAIVVNVHRDEVMTTVLPGLAHQFTAELHDLVVRNRDVAVAIGSYTSSSSDHEGLLVTHVPVVDG